MSAIILAIDLGKFNCLLPTMTRIRARGIRTDKTIPAVPRTELLRKHVVSMVRVARSPAFEVHFLHAALKLTPPTLDANTFSLQMHSARQIKEIESSFQRITCNSGRPSCTATAPSAVTIVPRTDKTSSALVTFKCATPKSVTGHPSK